MYISDTRRSIKTRLPKNHRCVRTSILKYSVVGEHEIFKGLASINRKERDPSEKFVSSAIIKNFPNMPYLILSIWDKCEFPCCISSHNLPGVATTISGPFARILSCFTAAIPPTTTATFIPINNNIQIWNSPYISFCVYLYILLHSLNDFLLALLALWWESK